jgi:mRNA interferase ChpB
MSRHHIPQRGDVYLLNPNPQSGRKMKDMHRFVVITPKEINQLGVAMMVPITTGGAFSRIKGLTVTIMGHDTTGVAICNQVRSFDIEDRVKRGLAHYVETLAPHIADEIVLRVISILDPA